MLNWSNLAKVVYKRTYARNDTGVLESWKPTTQRVISANIAPYIGTNLLLPNEGEQLEALMLKRKAMPPGRGIWFSGAPSHARIGGAALCNCWGLTSENWYNFVIAMDLLMLGGGVGMTVEHKYTSKLPKTKKNVTIIHQSTKDADFIVSDSREGWLELTKRVFEAFFETGKSFSYSTICIRGPGESIKGFGGKASGPLPLIEFITKVTAIFKQREGLHIRPIDAGDILCCIGEVVVSGNVRRSALLIAGDSWDKDYLKAKRWDLNSIPTQRAFANYSVICDDIDDLHPLFWKTYEQGEPFGLVNRKNIQTFGRMGEKKKDSAIIVNPCVIGETEILTRDGYKRIDSLVNQSIDIWNGFEWSNVTPKVTGNNMPVYTVTFSNGKHLTCTKYHSFHIAKNYRGETEKLQTDQLEAGMKLIKHNFPIIEHGEEYEYAYTQGFISAEGMDGYKHLCVYEPKEMCIARLKGVKGAKSNNRTYFSFKHETLPKAFIPFNWNLKSRLDWLAGLFDGDGTELKEGGLQLSSVNLEFLANLQKLLTTLGIESKIVPASSAKFRFMPDGKGGSKEYFCQESRRICIGAIQMQMLKNLGLKCERLSFDKTPQRDASQFVTVVDITEAGEADTVYCFNESKRHLGIFNGIITGQCAEAQLENFEPCNLQEIFLPNLKDQAEFNLSARLMHRYGKRVTMEKFHNPENDEVVKRNRRIGTGITGCLQSSLFTKEALNEAYNVIQEENKAYSKQLNIPESIRTTVIKPSGTLSLLGDCTPGIHPSYSKYYIRRVRFASNDQLIPLLKSAGHYMEPVIKFDGTLDPNTLVVNFYCETPENTPCADEGFDTWKQLDTLLFAQKYWSDQAVSVTVYYKKEELNEIKAWLSLNLKNIKTISFLCYNDHGFKQAPLEKTTKEEFIKFNNKIKDINIEQIDMGDIESLECAGGVCPVK